MVYDGENSVISSAGREVRDEIHCNRLKGKSVGVCRNSVWGRFCWVRANFILLTSRTSLHILLYPLS
jgi:hypothetical protein